MWTHQGKLLTLSLEFPDDDSQEGVLRRHMTPPDGHGSPPGRMLSGRPRTSEPVPLRSAETGSRGAPRGFFCQHSVILLFLYAFWFFPPFSPLHFSCPAARPAEVSPRRPQTRSSTETQRCSGADSATFHRLSAARERLVCAGGLLLLLWRGRSERGARRGAARSARRENPHGGADKERERERERRQSGRVTEYSNALQNLLLPELHQKNVTHFKSENLKK